MLVLVHDVGDDGGEGGDCGLASLGPFLETGDEVGGELLEGDFLSHLRCSGGGVVSWVGELRS